jgi:hypothetical protein
MPLLDNFHPPLSVERHWESFHARWATAIADTLNDGRLPPAYFAEIQVHAGPRVEIDVGTFESAERGAAAGAATATVAAPVWAPSAPALVMPAAFPDELEVLVFNGEGGPTLVAAVELVSPRNKDRAASRRAFAVKCASYLLQGIGLVVADVVTNRQANFHDEIVRVLELGDDFRLTTASPLLAVAYRPAHRDAADQIDVWSEALTLGRELPTLPLPIQGYGMIPLDLEAAYTDARRRLRLD